MLGDGGRERLRGLAGSCSSVVARERHVTRCLATLSNGGRLLQRPRPPRQFPWQLVKSLNGRFRRRCCEPVRKRGLGEGQVVRGTRRALARSLARAGGLENNAARRLHSHTTHPAIAAVFVFATRTADLCTCCETASGLTGDGTSSRTRRGNKAPSLSKCGTSGYGK